MSAEFVPVVQAVNSLHVPENAVPVDRYERDIVDMLWGYEKEGKGKLIELCTVQVGNKQLPFVAFATGSDVVVTARHHINEFWGPTEAVMQLAASGQEGLFLLVPVVDVEYYDESEAKKKRILSFGGSETSACMYAMFSGYREGPPSNAKHQWDDYRYGKDSSPAYITAVKRLIDGCKLFVDIHNSNLREFFFYTFPIGVNMEPQLYQILGKEIEGSGQKLKTDIPYYSSPGVIQRTCLAPGVYPKRGYDSSIGYAAKVGKINFAVEIPIFDYRTVTPGKWDNVNDVKEVANVTAGAITSLKRALTAQEKI